MARTRRGARGEVPASALQTTAPFEKASGVSGPAQPSPGGGGNKRAVQRPSQQAKGAMQRPGRVAAQRLSERQP